MTRLFKKVLPILVIATLIISMFTINASAAGSTIAFSKNKLQVGETLTVTARFSTASGNPMYGLEAFITYDSKVLQFVSGENANRLTDGKIKIVLTSAGKISLSETVTFKAIKIGSSAVNIESIVYVDKNDVEQSLSGSSATVNVINTSTEASNNANLKGLNVSAGELVPAFSPDVTSYNVTIPYTETELWVQPSKADAKATYIVEGSATMQVGFNKRTIIVTAENGSTKSYVVNITRLDENGQVPGDAEPPMQDNKIEVTANGDILYIDEDFSDVEVPKGFEITDYVYNEQTVPSISDGAYVMLYLVDPEEVNTGFYVIDSNMEFTQLITVYSSNVAYYVLPVDGTPVGYKAVDGYKIGETLVPAFVSETDATSDFFLIYAKGPAGKTAFYRYDTIDQTLQRQTDVTFAEETVPEEETEDAGGIPARIVAWFLALTTSGMIVVITILVIIILLIVAIIVLIIKIVNSAPDRKEKKANKKASQLEENLESVGFEYISMTEPEQAYVPTAEAAEETAIEEAEGEETDEETSKEDAVEDEENE